MLFASLFRFQSLTRLVRRDDRQLVRLVAERPSHF
jgi:hypothetical protein